MYRVTYEKRDQTRFTRDLKHRPLVEAGDITSNGWKIINIQVLDGKKLYTEEQYHEKILKQSSRDKRKNRIKEKISSILFRDIDLFKSQKRYRNQSIAQMVQLKIDLYESVKGNKQKWR